MSAANRKCVVGWPFATTAPKSEFRETTAVAPNQSPAARSDRRASLAARLRPTPGRDQGQTAMQIAQPCVWLKNGRHLSKSTYHFSTPRTVFFLADRASGGQASSQIRQLWQKSSTPCARAVVVAKGASVRTAESLNEAPNSGLMIEPCFPSSPKPQARAGGIIAKAPVMGPVTASASQPCVLIHPATVLAALIARLYCSMTSRPASTPGAFEIDG